MAPAVEPGYTMAVTQAMSAATGRVGDQGAGCGTWTHHSRDTSEVGRHGVALGSTEVYRCLSLGETASRANTYTDSEIRGKDMCETVQVFRHASRRTGLAATDLRLAGLLSRMSCCVGIAGLGWRREGSDSG